MMINYKTTLASIVLSLAVAVGCDTNDHAVPIIPPYSDAGHMEESWDTECLIDDVIETIDVRYDDDNCGGCGISCEEIAQCFDGDCLYPGFLDTECENDSWCAPGQVCESRYPAEGTFCIIPENVGCEFEDVCTGEDELCISGYCTEVTEEICDGLDNDRDGQIDDDVDPMRCYGGPLETRGIGLCTDGQALCIDGIYEDCIGSILPVEEAGILACDGLDNDCDGCADDKYNGVGECRDAEPTAFDIIVMMDVSGSMADEIDAAIMTAEEFAARFAGNPYFRFALFKFPIGSFESWNSGMVRPFGSFAEYQNGLEEIYEEPFSGEFFEEQSRDFPYLIATDYFEPAGLRFRDNSQRIYIMFTDEPPQTFPFLTPYVTDELLCDAFQEDDVFAVVTSPRLFSLWSCAQMYSLTNDSDILVEEFDGILNSACDPSFEFDPIGPERRDVPLPVPGYD